MAVQSSNAVVRIACVGLGYWGPNLPGRFTQQLGCQVAACGDQDEACLTSVEKRGFLAPGVCMANENFMGRTEGRLRRMGGPLMWRAAGAGPNAILIPDVTIGQEAAEGADAVVTRDVPAYQTAVGVPARAIRPALPGQLLKNRLPEVWADLIRRRGKGGA